MTIQITTAPTADAIDLAEAKAHLRVPFSNDDAMIRAWLSAATDYASLRTRKQTVMARCKQTMDAFPSSCSNYTGYGQTFARPGNAIYLERGPVAQVVSIQYLDMQGVTQTVPPATYTVDLSSDPVRITPVFGQIWPIPMPQIGAVWVTFDAGYANPFTASGNILTTINGPVYTVGQVIRLSNSGGALPTPLKEKTDYYVITVTGSQITLSATSGGSVIPLTDTGTGTNYIGVVPSGLTAWLKLRLASMYENREELDALGTIAPLPYADRLLDGYTTFEF